MREALPEAYENLVQHAATAGTALQGHAGHRVHRAGGRAVHAPDALGEARTGAGAVKIAVDLVSEGLVDARAAIGMVDPRATPTSFCTRSSGTRRRTPRTSSASACPPRRARRWARWCSTPPQPRSVPSAGQEVRAGARGDLPRGRRRHERRRGHPDGARRHDLARGCGRARLGQDVRLRCAELVVDEENRWLSPAASSCTSTTGCPSTAPPAR